jgi:methionyl-tRNA synthetase
MTQKLLVLVAPPYANNRLHIAHIRSTYLPADILARHARMTGREVYLIGGADEYGLPIVMESDRSQRSPQEIVDECYASHTRDFAELDISFDIFSRTTSANHPRTDYEFYEAAKRAGRIYRKAVTVPYCQRCERFLFDRYLAGECPRCHAVADGDHCNACGFHIEDGQLRSPRCARCSDAPQRIPDEHVFFRISDRIDYLKQEVLSKPNMPAEVKTEVAGIEHFMDWDITRVQQWGVQIPDAPGKAFYMIFEAFPNYVTFTADLAERLGRPDLVREVWNEDSAFEHVYFMGRDLVFLHVSIWPLMLAANGMRRPDVLHGGGLLNYGGQKMSKSKGWMISVSDFLASFDGDLLRYYLARFSPYTADAEFDWRQFQDIIQREFHVLTAPFATSSEHEAPGDALVGKDLEELFAAVARSIRACRFDEALGSVVSFYAQVSPKALARTDAGLLAANLALLLAPFMPRTAARLWRMLGLGGEVSEQRWAPVPRDLPGLNRERVSAVRSAFPQLDDRAVSGFLERLASIQFESKSCFLATQAASMRG